MQKTTHALLGVAFAAILGAAWTRTPLGIRSTLGFLDPFSSFPILFHIGLSRSLFLLLEGAMFGVLPDVDIFLKGVLDHRCGFTHSLISILVIFPFLATLLRISPLIGFFCTLSHWLFDAITFQGVRTWGASIDFFLGHKCDFRLAKLRSNNRIANSLLCLASLLVLGAFI